MVESFTRTVNFWYPTMTTSKIKDLQHRTVCGRLGESVKLCLDLLVMALGAASKLVSSVAASDESDPEETEMQNQQKVMSELYFDSALKRIHVAHMECSIDSTQCLFFAACVYPYTSSFGIVSS